MAGYEPLFLSVTVALGNVTLDGVFPLLATYLMHDVRFKLARAGPAECSVCGGLFRLFNPAWRSRREGGPKFFRTDSYFVIKPGESKSLGGASTEADALGLVTALANGAEERQGATIAKVRFVTTDGRTLERTLLAGIDTTEWAIDSPGVANTGQHKKASVFDSHPVDGGTYNGYRFWSLTRFDTAVRLSRIDIENISNRAELLIWKASLYDSKTRRSIPLPHYDESKWRPVYDANNLLVLENDRALPRAWLVAEAEAVGGEESLRRIRGESVQSFDPGRTALLEVAPENLPQLPGGIISPAAQAQIVAEQSNRLTIETKADTAAVLVVSEINYPGWEATLDGVGVPIYTADFLLRGVVVPSGTHRVEMRYTAPEARKGALISGLSLCVLLGLGIYSRRRR